MVGFGPVGQGVAARARDLGALVTVVDLDPVRLVQAQHDGCRVAAMEDALHGECDRDRHRFRRCGGCRSDRACRRRSDSGQRRPQRSRDRRRLARPARTHNGATAPRPIRGRWPARSCSTAAAWSTLLQDSASAHRSCSTRSRRSCCSGSTPSSSGDTADLANGVQRYPRPLEARITRALVAGTSH